MKTVLLAVCAVNLHFTIIGVLPESVVKKSFCSLQYQNVNLDSNGNNKQIGSASGYYFPSCVRVPRCSGCCEESMIGGALHQCLPTGIRYESVLQIAQTIQMSPSEYPATNTSKLMHIRRRVAKVAIHTGCECRCKTNPTGTCLSVHHRFHNDTCRCECQNRGVSSLCAQHITPFGTKFWSEEECQCKCPQYLTPYVVQQDNPRILCSSNFIFDDTLCRFAFSFNTMMPFNHVFVSFQMCPSESIKAAHTTLQYKYKVY